MASVLADILSNIEEIIASLTILFPGFLAYFVYLGLRAPDFEEIKRGHLVLILFSTLFFQILQNLSGPLMESQWYQILFFFAFPVILGAAADISHRLYTTVFVRKYQEMIVDNIGSLGLVDVGNVSRWQKTVKSYVQDGLNDITKEYYIEVDVIVSPDESRVKRGFLNGYSEDDIEIIRYDDLTEKDFSGIGNPDIDEGQLTMTVELIPRDQIASVRIYRVKMEDFELE